MKQEQIKTLIDALAGSDLSELEYSENGSTLRLVKQSAAGSAPRRPLPRAVQNAVDAAPARNEPAPAPAASAPAELCAPLYGVVHLQSSPGEPPFVQAGQSIQAGQTLCVIEAMKVFNEVQIDHAATIAEVLVRSGEEVEAGRPLFRLAQG
ncbi:acetyl-CoA carboxylase biotin carboxyl carrier protein [Variovorax sp. HW608]|uniref:acetyl-CoA carboxylase biotin carboxyl carrier protein n=1 Tax=Variovorax sp. HW608 TaxID=1034889 RepID=UPI00081FC53B|nr:acetyl-CoA carboxylase biotin carboxyl carrier protein subunit [Variovorax sp. HW608]SCK25316.1 acetyl-CoA carboxylase biotin carboxyl carrier protein [Variovorax sp. HW608]